MAHKKPGTIIATSLLIPEFFQTGSEEGKIGDTRKGEDGMKILDSKFMKGFIKMADDGFQQGWHERNGGNLSYRLKAEEVEMIRPRLNAPGEWQPIGTEVPGLAGEFFLVTGSGKYFRNIAVDPEACLAII